MSAVDENASLEEIWDHNQELSKTISRKDMEINSINSRLDDEQNLVAALQKKIKELQVGKDLVNCFKFVLSCFTN